MEEVVLFILKRVNNKGADENARLRRLVSALVVAGMQKSGFSGRGPNSWAWGRAQMIHISFRTVTVSLRARYFLV